MLQHLIPQNHILISKVSSPFDFMAIEIQLDTDEEHAIHQQLLRNDELYSRSWIFLGHHVSYQEPINDYFWLVV